MAEVLLAFMGHAGNYYRHSDGRPTSEVGNFKMAFRPVREMYAHAPATEFGPVALKAVREQMIQRGWCRQQVNAATNRVKRAFKWAASEELIPVSVYQSLATVAGLQAGRSAAPDRDPVAPVEDDTVDATLPFLNRHVVGLVRF